MPRPSCSWSASATSCTATRRLSPLTSCKSLSSLRSNCCRSASINSVLIDLNVAAGRALPTRGRHSRRSSAPCTMTAVSRMLARNWLPSPSPRLAPLTSPAISMNSTVAWMTFSGFEQFGEPVGAHVGHGTTALLSSIVQKG